MLIEFTVSNFRSFLDEQKLSLVATDRDKKHPENLIQTDCGLTLLKVVTLYGANASGKSNLLNAMRVMDQFVELSATAMTQGDEIPGMVPFRLNLRASKQPSRFKITIIVDGKTYEYGFAADSHRVHEEWLTQYNGAKPSRCFDRRLNAATGKTSWFFGPDLKPDEKLLREKTRDNGLVVSRGAELNIPVFKPVFGWFKKYFLPYDLSMPPVVLSATTIKGIQKKPELRNEIVAMFRYADLGIDDLLIEDQEITVPKEVWTFFTEEVREHLKGKRPALFTVHNSPEIGKVRFSLEEESNGTQRFFALAGPWLGALENGATLMIDEFECSMHPLLVRKLLEFYQSPSNNKKGAQLILATQDATMMDLSLFRRDQIWIVEKSVDGSSTCFSLYEFKKKPRNTEALQRNYLAGRYGGVPKTRGAFEEPGEYPE